MVAERYQSVCVLIALAQSRTRAVTRGAGESSRRRARCTLTPGGIRGETTWTTASTKGNVTLKRCTSHQHKLATRSLLWTDTWRADSHRRRIMSRTERALCTLLKSTDAKKKDAANSSKLGGLFSPTWVGTSASRMRREALAVRGQSSPAPDRRSKCRGRGSGRSTTTQCRWRCTRPSRRSGT